MVTVLVVRTGLCVASGIVPASAFAAGGSLVPAVACLARRAGGQNGRVGFGRVGGTPDGGQGQEKNPAVCFHLNGSILRRGKCAFAR